MSMIKRFAERVRRIINRQAVGSPTAQATPQGFEISFRIVDGFKPDIYAEEYHFAAKGVVDLDLFEEIVLLTLIDRLDCSKAMAKLKMLESQIDGTAEDTPPQCPKDCPTLAKLPEHQGFFVPAASKS